MANSDFTARIIAELDTSKIPSQLKKVGNENPLILKNIRLDTSGLPSQIQGSLDNHKFTISLDGIKMANIESQAQQAGSKISNGLVNSIKRQLDNGGIESSIAKVTAQFEKLGASGHTKLETIKEDIATLNNLQAQMQTANNPTALVSGYTQYADVLARVKNNLATVSAETKVFVTANQKLELDNEMALWLQKNTNAAKQYGAKIRELRNELSALDSSDYKGYQRIQNEFAGVKGQTISAEKAGTKFISTFKGAFKSIMRYASVSMIIYQVVNAFRQMYQNVVQINTAMTELKKVTDETETSYERFLSTAGKTAQKIGTTITEYVNSTADFARLGYNLSDAQELAKVASIYSVVGDEIESIDVATQSIISTMTAFGVKASETISIVDKFNAVGNNFAISSGGIGDALQRSASSLAAANNTLDQSIALITAANTVVQDPDSVGTAFKTMSARIRGAATELEELGEEAISISKVREEIMALSGVDVMQDENTFKSTYQIIDELSKKWSDLKDIQQASITEILGGKRQANVISALMTNFDIARDALDTSLNSDGSAMAEHAKWMESLEAKTQQFKAAWEELSEAFLDEDFLGKTIDGLTGVLNAVTFCIDKFGLLGVAFVGIGFAYLIKNFDKLRALSLQNSKNYDLLAFSTRNLSNEETAAILVKSRLSSEEQERIMTSRGLTEAQAKEALSAAQLKQKDDELAASSAGLGVKVKSLAVAWKSFAPMLIVTGLSLLSGAISDIEGKTGSAAKTIVAAVVLILTVVTLAVKTIDGSIKSFMASNPLGWILAAITLVVVAFKALVEGIIGWANASTRAKEAAVTAAKDAKEAWEEARDELKDLDDELETAHDRLKELQDLSDKGTITLVEEQELKKLQESIALMEAQRSALEARELITRVDAERTAADAINKTRDEKLSDAYVQEDNGFWKGVGRVASSIFSFGISDKFGFGISDWSIKKTTADEYINEILDMMQRGEELSDQQSQFLTEFYNGLGEQADTLSYHSGENLEQWEKDANEAYNTYWEYIHKLNIAEGQYDKDWSHVISMERFDGVDETLTDLANAGEVSESTLRSLYETNDAFRDMIDYLIQLGIFSWDDASQVSGLINQIEALETSSQAAERQVIKLSSTISEYMGKYNVLKSAIDEYNSYGQVTADTYNKVVALGEDYADLFDFSNGKIELAADEVNSLVESLVDEYGATLAANGATDGQIRSMVKLVNTLSMAEDKTEDIVDTIQDLADILKDVSEGGEMSALEVYELITTYPELASAISKTTNGYILEAEAVKNLIRQKAELLKINASDERMAARQNFINNTNNEESANNVERIFSDYYNRTGTNIHSFDEYKTAWESYFGRTSNGVDFVEGLQEYVEAIIQDDSVNNVMSSIIEDLKDPDTLLSQENGETIQDRFDNLQKLYEGRLKGLEYLSSTYENAIQSLENNGQDDTTAYYEKLKEIEEQNIQLLNEELRALTALFRDGINSGEIKEGSEEFYEMNDAINSVKSAIQESNLAIQEYSNTIRDIQWKQFDKVQDRIAGITKEADFLIDLLESKDLLDESGKLTEYGNAAMGLHGVNYNVYMEQAKRYAEEIARIEKEIADDPNNQNLIDRREELLDLQRDSIQAAEDEKEAIVDLISDGIEAELDALDEIIDKYKDALDSAKDLYDYQNKVADATQEVAKLQKMIIAYENDTSEETRAQIQKLKVDLQEAQEELQETEYDQFIADQKQLLDTLYLEYEEILNRRLDDIDALIYSAVGAINDNASGIMGTLESVANATGATLSDSMQSIWDTWDKGEGTRDVIRYYGDDFQSGIDNANGILGNIDGGMTTVSDAVSTIEGKVNSASDDLGDINVGISSLAGKLSSSLTSILTAINNAGNAHNPNGTDGSGNGVGGSGGSDSGITEQAHNPVITHSPPSTSSSNTSKDNKKQEKQEETPKKVLKSTGILNSSDYSVEGLNKWSAGWDDCTVTIGGQEFKVATYDSEKKTVSETKQRSLNNLFGGTMPAPGTLAGLDGVVYVVSRDGGWVDFADKNKRLEMTTAFFAKLNSYKSGGLADYTGLAWMDGTKSNPEMVLDAEDTRNFVELRNVLQQLADADISLEDVAYSMFTPLPHSIGADDFSDRLLKALESQKSETTIENHFDITIPIDHVDNYNDFVRKLQKDGKFEKMVQDMTVNRISGGSSLAKNKYSW